jgi:hypothetical protein
MHLNLDKLMTSRREYKLYMNESTKHTKTENTKVKKNYTEMKWKYKAQIALAKVH